MKQYIAAAAFCLAISPLAAQINNQDSPETLFSSGTSIAWGGMVGTGIHFSTLDGQPMVLHQVSLAAVLNHNFRLGFSYYHQLEELTFSTALGDYRQDLQMGSLDFEYVFFPNKVVHFSLPLSIGLGELEYDDELAFDDWSGIYDESYFGFIQPGVQVEVNVHKYVRLHGGANYRLAIGADNPLLNDAALSGFSANIGLRLGLF